MSNYKDKTVPLNLSGLLDKGEFTWFSCSRGELKSLVVASLRQLEEER
jgi:hypothetical protein